MFFSKTAAVLLLQASVAIAATQVVKVGGNGALVFDPTTVTAEAGDTVRFQFLDLNHTATAGTPGAGCKPSGKFNSGFVPIAAGTNPGSTFDVKITDTQPITVYCAQAQHCQASMVMVINPTQDGATSLAAYQRVCSRAKTNVAPARANGGTLRNVQKGKNAGANAKKAKNAGANGANGANAKKAKKAGGNGANGANNANRANGKGAKNAKKTKAAAQRIRKVRKTI